MVCQACEEVREEGASGEDPGAPEGLVWLIPSKSTKNFPIANASVCIGRFLLSTRLSRVARQAKTKHMDALKTFRKNKDTQARPLEARYWVVLLGTGWYSWARSLQIGRLTRL
jgi:hypothetical protein